MLACKGPPCPHGTRGDLIGACPSPAGASALLAIIRSCSPALRRLGVSHNNLDPAAVRSLQVAASQSRPGLMLAA